MYNARIRNIYLRITPLYYTSNHLLLLLLLFLPYSSSSSTSSYPPFPPPPLLFLHCTSPLPASGAPDPAIGRLRPLGIYTVIQLYTSQYFSKVYFNIRYHLQDQNRAPRADFRAPSCLGSQFYHFSLFDILPLGGGGGQGLLEKTRI